MNNNKLKPSNKRGSVWRKWDLHVHAPSKFTCAKNDQFVGRTLEEKQNNFLEGLKALKNISVLGITDYFSLDGYKMVNERRDELDNIDLILPNIELRLTPETSDRNKINIHIIANTQILSIEEVEGFLHSFIFLHSGEDHNCSEERLINLGKKIDSTLSNEAAFKQGLNEFSITYDAFFKKLKKKDSRFKTNILIGVSNNSGDGASGIKDLPEIRKIIYRGVDFILSGNPSDIEYFLGKGSDTKKEVEQKYASLKPCMHGSDYHGSKSGNTICIPDKDRFCWIKANPTFEGLKQVIYEPAERVKIQPFEPDSADKQYRICELKYSVKDKQKIIPLNPYLNSIIGVRGSGKSTLLKNIVSKILPDEISTGVKHPFF